MWQVAFSLHVKTSHLRIYCSLLVLLSGLGLAPWFGAAAQTAGLATNASGADSVYTVKSGDTLAGIARTHQVTVRALRATNGLTNDLIRAGQTLRIPVQMRPAPARIAAHHSLWRVQGPRATVYLMGSVHVLKQDDYPLPAVLEAAFTNASVVAFEADIGEMEQPATQFKLLNKSMLPEGQTLAQQLSPELYSGFTNEVATAGLPLFVFDRLKPAIAAVTLIALELQKLGLDPEYGLDKYFYARARKAQKPTEALETVDFQFNLLSGFSKEESELLMKMTLRDIDKAKKECAEMIRAWRTGDPEALDKLLNEASREAPALFKRLISDRNQNWAPKIREWLKGDKNVLVVVGAGHLVGKQGLVSLLQAEGFKVEQL